MIVDNNIPVPVTPLPPLHNFAIWKQLHTLDL